MDNERETIDNLASIKGRLLLQDIYHKIRFERQRNSTATSLIMWKICISDGDALNEYLTDKVELRYPQGFFKGTNLWLEEIVNRHYFSTINSFVYFGAAVLLALIGLNRFSDFLPEKYILYGLGFEVLMLLFMFVVMLFAPNDDLQAQDESSDDLAKELIDEVGEISRDLAVTSSQLDKITDHLLAITDRQNELYSILLNIAKTNSDVVNPNPQMLEIMQETNKTLFEFKQNIIELNDTTKKLQQEEIEFAVRKEIERFLTNKVK